MPIVGATTFADFAAASAQQNTRVRFRADGTSPRIELASRNLLSNPDLRDLLTDTDAAGENAESGAAEGVTLSAAGAPAGWGVLMRRLDDPNAPARITRQTLDELPMRRDFYDQTGPLVEGPEPVDVTKRARIAPPFRPRVELLARGREGYAAGAHGLSYAWIVGPRPGRTARLTAPAPLVYVTLLEGEGMDVILPETFPEGATGIAILKTDAQATEAAAATAPLWVQRRLSIKRGMPPSYKLTGPMRKEERAPRANKTYVGAYNQWGPPDFLFARAVSNLPAMTTRLSYQFLTDFGWSASQGLTRVIDIKSVRRGEKLVWWPRRLPPGTKAWRPIFQAKDGLYYALAARRPREGAEIRANEPGEFTDGGTAEQVPRGRFAEEEDQTGLPSPDAALEAPRIVLVPAIDPGKYAVRAVLYDSDDRETASSEPVIVDVPAGYYPRVHRPPGGNMIPNAARVSLDRISALPDGWSFPGATPGLDVDPGGGGNWVIVTDASGAAVDEDVALTPSSDLDFSVNESGRRAIRVVADVTRRVSGGVRVLMRFWDGWSDTATYLGQEVIGESASPGRRAFRKALQKSGSALGADITAPAGAVRARLVVRMIGADAAYGVRNLDVNLTSFGMLKGFAAPPRHAWNRSPVVDDELEDDAYPAGGACVLVENPLSRHADLAGVNLNAVDYYGPAGTPKSAEYFLTGYRTPVRENQTYTLSAYVGFEGVTVSTEYFVTAVKDARGRTLLTNPALVGNVSGAAPAARHAMTFTAPGGASYVEIVSGGGSDGYARAMAFQLDEGPVATAYTNQNALSGYRRFTFDTGLPGVPEGTKLSGLGRVAKWVSGGAVTTADGAITNVDVSFRSTDVDPLLAVETDWSPWTADFAGASSLGRRYWQIEVALFTTDPLESPYVDWAGLEIGRPYPVLLRPTGSEYPGGIQVVDMPAPHSSRVRDEFVSDSNVRQTRRRGKRRKRAEGFGLEAYLDEAIEALLYDMDEGEGANVIEYPDTNRRLRVELENVAFSVEREAYWTFDEPRHWIHRAEGVNAEVLAEEALT